MSQIPALDYGFLLLETKESPTHVAALEIMRPPKGAAADYVKKFAAKLRERKPCSPFRPRPTFRFHSCSTMAGILVDRYEKTCAVP